MEEIQWKKTFVTIEYKTANGNKVCVEVSTSVKELLEQSDRQIQSQGRQDRRYLDYAGFIDGLTDAAIRFPDISDPAELVLKAESQTQLYAAIANSLALVIVADLPLPRLNTLVLQR